MKSWIDSRLGETYPGHEVNLVFVRGLPTGSATAGLAALRREVLETGVAGGWTWAVHDSFAPEIDDFDPVDYRPLCRDGAEAVVFMVEPCSAKAHAPDFTYYRDGRCVLHFSFEDLGQRVGDNPDYLSAELLAAGLIGPDADCRSAEGDEHDCFDHHYDDHNRLVRAIAAVFGLPSPPLAAGVAA